MKFFTTTFAAPVIALAFGHMVAAAPVAESASVCFDKAAGSTSCTIAVGYQPYVDLFGLPADSWPCNGAVAGSTWRICCDTGDDYNCGGFRDGTKTFGLAAYDY